MKIEVGNLFYVTEDWPYYSNLRRKELVRVVGITDIGLRVKSCDTVRGLFDITWGTLKKVLIDANTVKHNVFVQKNGFTEQINIVGLCNAEARVYRIIGGDIDIVTWRYVPEPGIVKYDVYGDNIVESVTIIAVLPE